MHCYVGMTTDPERRRAQWENTVDGLRNWKILKRFDSEYSYDRALDYERDYARQHGCEAEPGGRRAPGPWYVYYFEYSRKR